MKKFFTLISVALTAMSVNAQEVWTAADFDLTTATTQDITEGIYADGNAEGPNTAVPGKLTTSIITASTKSVIMTGLSTPNADEMQEVIDGKKTAWEIKGGGNMAIVLNDPNGDADRDTLFSHYIIGKGNPELIHWEYDEETDNGTSHRVAGTYWERTATTPPAKGAYWRFDVKAGGQLSLGVFGNKQKKEAWIFNATDGKLVPNTDIEVAIYYQNNGFVYAKETDDNGETVPGSEKYLNKGTMPESYIPHDVNEVGQGRPYIGTFTFPVEAGKTYYAFNSSTQLGLYGFTFIDAQTLGVSSMKAENADAPLYNLAGQRVAFGTKGLLIKNGKKFIVK